MYLRTKKKLRVNGTETCYFWTKIFFAAEGNWHSRYWNRPLHTIV